MKSIDWMQIPLIRYILVFSNNVPINHKLTIKNTYLKSELKAKFSAVIWNLKSESALFGIQPSVMLMAMNSKVFAKSVWYLVWRRKRIFSISSIKKLWMMGILVLKLTHEFGFPYFLWTLYIWYFMVPSQPLEQPNIRMTWLWPENLVDIRGTIRLQLNNRDWVHPMFQNTWNEQACVFRSSWLFIGIYLTVMLLKRQFLCWIWAPAPRVCSERVGQ